MPTLHIYPQPDLPAIFKWQAIAFMRTAWSDIFQGDNLYVSETFPPENQPVHFALAEGESLISYAAILEFSLNHCGNTYRGYGLGNMFTFPPFRKQGYGSQVLQAATRFIQTSTADIGILFCHPTLEPFYAAQGWQTTASQTRLGQPDHFQVYDSSRMMLFISEKGLANQKDFDRQPIYVDWPW
ncbi:MAG TPA: GNAT family N-acetyltransferase [Anaerolineales bacterium]|nr:GNAT family N-acetyltransferase [Anaerolineales bacterium]